MEFLALQQKYINHIKTLSAWYEWILANFEVGVYSVKQMDQSSKFVDIYFSDFIIC